MLTMSRTCNASDRGSWKESYRTADSVESLEDSADSDTGSSNSSSGSSSSSNGNRNDASIHHHHHHPHHHDHGSHHQTTTTASSHSPPPIGCITTHRVSTVIRPERKMPPIDPLQFVKIQQNELCKKAVEQIKLAEEVKITKEKIKEVEEEWQNNLMNWKSKRKLTKNNSDDDAFMPKNNNRKTKTFSEILNEKARSGARIGYNLHKYIGYEDELENDPLGTDMVAPVAEYSDTKENLDHKQLNQSSSLQPTASQSTVDDHMSSSMPSPQRDSNELPSVADQPPPPPLTDDQPHQQNNGCRNGLGEVVVFDTTLLQEFCVKKSDSNCDIDQTSERPTGGNENNGSASVAGAENEIRHNQQSGVGSTGDDCFNSAASPVVHQSIMPVTTNSAASRKVNVPIKDWKSSHSKSSPHPNSNANNRQQSCSARSSEDDIHQHSSQQNSSFDVEDEEEDLDEEMERLRLDQERSFKAKLYAFESLAKQEEEAVRRAEEANRRRQQNRAKLAAERSKSLVNIRQDNFAQRKPPLTASHSVSSSSIHPNDSTAIVQESIAPSVVRSQFEKQSKSSQNLNSYAYDLPRSPPNSNSVVYNFTNRQKSDSDSSPISSSRDESKKEMINMETVPHVEKAREKEDSKKPSDDIQHSSSLNTASLSHSASVEETEPLHSTAPQHQTTSFNNNQPNQDENSRIYENIVPLNQVSSLSSNSQSVQCNVSTSPVADSNAIRNASQKLLQQQQQIYQNQPLPVQPSVSIYSQPYSGGHYSNVPPQGEFVYSYELPPLQKQKPQLTQLHQYPVSSSMTPNSTSAAASVDSFPIQAPTDALCANETKVISPIPVRGYSIADDVGLPPIQITKTTQAYGKSQQNPGHHLNHQQQQPPVMTPTLPEEEHLYVNQNQLKLTTSAPSIHNTKIPVYDHHSTGANYDSYMNVEPNYENNTSPEQAFAAGPPQHVSSSYMNYTHHLYYPKPYSAVNSSLKTNIPKQQPPTVGPSILQNNANNSRYVPNGPNAAPAGYRVAYNQNHWLLQEAELRRQLDSMESSSQRMKSVSSGIPHPIPQQQQQPHQPKSGSSSSGGYLSVSGKKKCSSCGDELGKGCAAMVVESLSLYYHINCFRCSVCNVQLGNGTVGTDVRVRNNKLHCQNCYSNDEAGLKFSRV